ncbi:MAG: glycoside hydrolase family 3 C-terminal domain-containing protein [Tannerellaceae bacterium]|jgi:beta-glucosidase|nr:glycoside hydrolase family 3 C-terminal domain-containing protein [Tannerellaceae bacterium]
MKQIDRLLFFSAVAVGASLLCSAGAQTVDEYKDPRVPVERRVESLLSQMTLEEKVNQLQSQLTFLHEYDSRKWEVGHFRNIAHFLHNTAAGPASTAACAEAVNEDTRKAIAASRLGIPVLQNGEALHGAQWGMTTCFPQSISMAASFDDEFYYAVGQAVARETRAAGVRQVFAPVINISRDPRWGRTEEGYGEDPHLNARMGVAWTKALEENGVVASPKHYVDNYGDGGHDSFASGLSWRTLREVFLEPFRACIEEGGARSIMAAYNSIDGVPCSSNKRLLTDILRGEWGFRGFVVSDYSGMPGVYGAHKVAVSHEDAQAQCFDAGMDVGLGFGELASYSHLLELVKSGRVSEAAVDASVRRVLRVKFELGLFENPYVDVKEAERTVNCKAHKDLALEAARKVMTLLQNRNGVLPLSDKAVKRIGVFGPAANKVSTGDYSGPSGGLKGEFLRDMVTPYDGLRKRLAGRAEVILHEGQDGAGDVAASCDVVIFFAAIQEGEGEDRSLLSLPKRTMKVAESLSHANIVDAGSEGKTFELDQEAMIDEISRSGAKTIVVLQNGSIIDVRNWANKVDAILEAWYPGERGGVAIAETLFGDNNPGGRLPVSWARHSGQLPLYYYIKPSGRGYGYLDDDGRPLFPFGYGLSYTTFEYSNLVAPEKVNRNGDTKVRVTVRNTGERKGDAVVQLYLHDEYASVARPNKELKAFKRVTLSPGESREVELLLPYRSFGLWDRDLRFVVEPGSFDILINTDAETNVLKRTIVVD